MEREEHAACCLYRRDRWVRKRVGEGDEELGRKDGGGKGSSESSASTKREAKAKP